MKKQSSCRVLRSNHYIHLEAAYSLQLDRASPAIRVSLSKRRYPFMVAANANRVSEHTAEHINERIQEQTRESVARYAHATPEQIDQRLDELDREWDTERMVEINFASVVVIGCALGGLVDRRWLLLPT